MTKRILPKIPGTIRERSHLAIEPEIEQAIRFLARQHNCSFNFVKNTILAEGLGIKVRARYYDFKRPSRRTA
jgi:hypothetical protein